MIDPVKIGAAALQAAFAGPLGGHSARTVARELERAGVQVPQKALSSPVAARRTLVRLWILNAEARLYLRSVLATAMVRQGLVEAMQSAERLQRLWEQSASDGEDLSPRYMVYAMWLCSEKGPEGETLLTSVVERLDPELRRVFESTKKAAIDWAEECYVEATRAQRQRAEADAQADRARREAEQARHEAALQMKRTAAVLRDQGTRVARLQRRVRELEQDRAGWLSDREQLGWLIAEFERRLAEVRAASSQPPDEGPAPAGPLSDLSVLVVGDPDHAVGYRAAALALGAVKFAFIDGQCAPGERLASAIHAADVIVFNTAWSKHSAEAMVARHAGARTVLCQRRGGLTGFREAFARFATTPGGTGKGPRSGVQGT